MKATKILFLVMVICLLVNPAFADTFTMDPTYSVIVHKIKHLMGYSIGSFEKFDGTIELDAENKKVVKIDVNINVDSLNTRNQKRDEDLRSERFFDTTKFPEATFQSTKISKTKITGNLTLKGVTKRVTLDYHWAGVGKDQYGNTKMALSAKGKINRKDFGVSHNQKIEGKNWLLGDEVELTIEVQGKLEG